ncbi:MAG: DMT family transporter [Alphaproteobacteria bacterium]|nr:DMT family transporter [Rickettsiales bacterium]
MITKSASIIYLISSFINIFILVFIKRINGNKVLDITQIIFLRTLLSIILIVPFNIKNTIHIKCINKNTALLLLTLGVLASVDGYLWNFGLQQIPVNNAMIMLFLSPIITALLGNVILKEKIENTIKMSFAINTVAVFLVYHFSVDNINIGYILLILDFFIYGFTAIIIKKLHYYPASFLLMVRMIVLLPISFFTMKKLPMINKEIIWYTVIMSVGYITERTLLTKAYQIAKVTSIQPLRYFNVVFSSVLSYLILGEKLNVWQIIGISTIVISGIIIAKNKVKINTWSTK